MGTFASIYKGNNSFIPEDKRGEFASRVEKLFVAGGMMDMDTVQLFGKNIETIHKAKMGPKGMNFYYNYFEDNSWENAGFNKNKCCVWSNKIGWSHFNIAVTAAYVLEGQYTEGVSVVLVNGEPVDSWVYIAWMNYLFDDKKFGNDIENYLSLSTERLFRQSPDDMIIYWEEGSDIEFSEKLQKWFKDLRAQYDELMKEDISINNVLSYIVDLLEEAYNNYYNVFAFTEFFSETLENLHDKRYQVLWKIFENMVRDPKMKKIESVILEQEQDAAEKENANYRRSERGRRLSTSWSLMEPDEKKNKARMTLRRYMALVANKELRSKVFGF